MGACHSALRRSTGPCRMAGLRAVPCTKSSVAMVTRRMARSPHLSPPISSDGSPGRQTAWCFGVCRGRISTGMALPRRGSIPAASCWSGRRATRRFCGQWKRVCGLPVSLRSSGKSDRFRQWRAGACSLPRNTPASPPLSCGAGAPASRRRGNALCRMPLLPDGASLRCRRAQYAACRESADAGGGSSCCAAAAASWRHGKWRCRMRRIMYLFLPRWPIDRLRLLQRKGSAAPADETPFATVIDTAGRRLLAAVNPAAAAAGVAPGMPLADALSFVPRLVTALAEPVEDLAALQHLAEWCSRYSPWTAPDGNDGVKIEITGSDHLWGGEQALANDLLARLDRRQLTGRIAIADTIGTAWAMARFAETAQRVVIVKPGELRAALAALPVEALHLEPATGQGLRRVGLKRIGDLYAMPRDALAHRFGETVARRLDQAVGNMPEPLSPLGEVPSRRVRLSFAEPITEPAALLVATERLTADLVQRLAREGVGARRLDLGFYRVDGRVERIQLGTARPSRDPRHLTALFRERLDTVDPDLGIEDMILAAFAVESLSAEQISMPGQTARNETSGIAPLLDRLGNRLGLTALSRIETRESHIPERASLRVPIGRPPSSVAPGSRKPPRPIRLFEPPEPVEAFWLLPDDPPFRFTWRRRRHRVMHADGPERIADEWWQPDGSGDVDAIRDYYRVEDEDGRRFWLFRAGFHGGDHKPRWFIHGIFA